MQHNGQENIEFSAYVPDSLEFLGTERSLYLFAGTRWIDADIEAQHVNRRLAIAGSRRADRTSTPWLAGLGIEFGDAGSQPFRPAAWLRGL